MIELVQISLIFHHQSFRAICAVRNRPCWQKGLQRAALLSLSASESKFQQKLEAFCGIDDVLEFSTHPKNKWFENVLLDVFHMYGICFRLA